VNPHTEEATMATTQVPALVIEVIDAAEFSDPRSCASIFATTFSSAFDMLDCRQVCVSWFSQASGMRMRSAWFTRAALAPILFPEEG
jgi:hypothetical protein